MGSKEVHFSGATHRRRSCSPSIHIPTCTRTSCPRASPRSGGRTRRSCHRCTRSRDKGSWVRLAMRRSRWRGRTPWRAGCTWCRRRRSRTRTSRYTRGRGLLEDTKRFSMSRCPWERDWTGFHSTVRCPPSLKILQREIAKNSKDSFDSWHFETESGSNLLTVFQRPTKNACIKGWRGEISGFPGQNIYFVEYHFQTALKAALKRTLMRFASTKDPCERWRTS